MGDSTKKKHHYTPNFILRGFATTAERLWVLDKTSGHCWAKDGGPDARFDAFAENNYNSLLDSAGNWDTSIEDHLEKIDRFEFSAAAAALAQLRKGDPGGRRRHGVPIRRIRRRSA